MESSVCACFVVLIVLVTTACADESRLVSGQDTSPDSTFDCYFCSTSHGEEGVDGSCGNGFNSGVVYSYRNCAGTCTKNVVYDTETDAVVSINRLCESECPGNRHCTQEAHGRKTCSYCCSSHLCNSTTKVVSPSVVALLVLAILLFFAKV